MPVRLNPDSRVESGCRLPFRASAAGLLAICMAAALALGACSSHPRPPRSDVVESQIEDIPGVDTTVTNDNGFPLYGASTSSGSVKHGPSGRMTLPLEDDLTADRVVEILHTAVEASGGSFESSTLTLIRRAGTDAESEYSGPISSTDRWMARARLWWELTTPQDVAVTYRTTTSSDDLVVDASGLPDDSPAARPSIDHLRELVSDGLVPAPHRGEDRGWTVTARNRGPAVTLNRLDANTLDDEVWEALTVPALTGLVDDVKFNDPTSAAGGKGYDMSTSPRPSTKEPPSAPHPILVTLRVPPGQEEDLLDAEVVRALHAVPNLRFITLAFADPDSYDDPSYAIDLDQCTLERTEDLIEENGGTVPSLAPPSTSTSRGGREWATTPTSAPLRPKGLMTVTMNEAAWTFWRHLGCW